MPSKSPEQADLMRAAAHGWQKPGGGGPSKSVGREFMAADMGRQRTMAHKLRGNPGHSKRESY